MSRASRRVVLAARRHRARVGVCVDSVGTRGVGRRRRAFRLVGGVRRAFRLVGTRASIRAFYTARTRCGVRAIYKFFQPSCARVCPFRVCVTVSHLNASPRDRARAVTRRTRARSRARATRATRRIDGDAFTSTRATREIGARTRRTRGATVLTRADDGATAHRDHGGDDDDDDDGRGRARGRAAIAQSAR